MIDIRNCWTVGAEAENCTDWLNDIPPHLLHTQDMLRLTDSNHKRRDAFVELTRSKTDKAHQMLPLLIPVCK